MNPLSSTPLRLTPPLFTPTDGRGDSDDIDMSQCIVSMDACFSVIDYLHCGGHYLIPVYARSLFGLCCPTVRKQTRPKQLPGDSDFTTGFLTGPHWAGVLYKG